MKLHEFQAKEILDQHGIEVPRGGVAATLAQAQEIASSLDERVVIKAQIHAGGRGKAGGIKISHSSEEVKKAADSLLGTSLITGQTGPDGVPVRNVLVEELLEVDREIYLSIVIDGTTRGVMVMASEFGGMEIEEVADTKPEKILRIPIDPAIGFQPYQGRELAYDLNISPANIRTVSSLVGKLYRIFDELDCALLEINPLVITRDNRVLAADAKLEFDDDALFKHPNLESLRDPAQGDELEEKASSAGISYVKLDGDVGCIVNGAGLAMATMDVVMGAGCAPANFLDVGGSADEDKVARAMEIILSDQSVRMILINIFGGILRCDIVARGVIAAFEAGSYPSMPLVVRMLGTNHDEGRRLLKTSGLSVNLVDDLEGAANTLRSIG